MAAAQVPGGATAPATLTRLPATPAHTTITIHPVAPPTVVSPDIWTLPHDSTVLWSLTFLSVTKPPANAPAEFKSTEMCAIILATLSYDSLSAADATALRNANFAEHHLTAAGVSEVLEELLESRIFATQHDDLGRFLEAVKESALIDRSICSMRASCLRFPPLAR